MKRLRLVTEDYKENRFFQNLLLFFKYAVPEYLARIVTYGFISIGLLKAGDIFAVDRTSLLHIVVGLQVCGYLVTSILIYEGLYVLHDRYVISHGRFLGRSRHLLFPLLSVIWPMTLCCFAFAVAAHLLRSMSDGDDGDDDDDGGREDLDIRLA